MTRWDAALIANGGVGQGMRLAFPTVNRINGYLVTEILCADCTGTKATPGDCDSAAILAALRADDGKT